MEWDHVRRQMAEVLGAFYRVGGSETRGQGGGSRWWLELRCAILTWEGNDVTPCFSQKNKP
jgi:hypothetical protein